MKRLLKISATKLQRIFRFPATKLFARQNKGFCTDEKTRLAIVFISPFYLIINIHQPEDDSLIKSGLGRFV